MRRIVHAFVPCLLLDVCAAGFAIGLLIQSRVDNPLAIKVMLAAPTLASLLLFSLIVGFPDLMPANRVAFPVNLTLPVLQNGMLWTIVNLAISDSTGIQKVPAALAPATMWLRWDVLVAVAFVQVVVLSIMMRLTGRVRPAGGATNR